MKRFLKDYRLHEHTEALFLLILGIIIQVLDGSPLDLKERWSLAWETEFPREYFSPISQKFIKTVLSAIILVRCLTSVLYVLSGVVVLYCILRETSPKLMLPWLLISGVKSVFLTFLETLTGVYVCGAFGKVRKSCIEFVVSKAIELFFAAYLWACIRSIHKDMEREEEDAREEELLTKMVIHRVNLRRRRARSMIDETTLQKTANLNYFELKDVPNIIFDMLKTEEELSQDSLLSPGMMLASVSNMGSYDYLKTSMSLGELGFMDLNSFQVVGLDDERHLSPFKRAMKFLKVTKEDIERARDRRRNGSFVEGYSVPEEIPRSVCEAKPTVIKHPRQEEVYVAQLPSADKIKSVLKKKKMKKRHHEDILRDCLDFDSWSEEGSRGSYEKIIGFDEGTGNEEEDGESISREADEDAAPDFWFMTNKKDKVNRIGLFEPHILKRTDNYSRLYQQEFMNEIGPEVFDKASRLLKLTSISDVNARSGKRRETEDNRPGTSRGSEAEPTEATEPRRANRSQKVKKISFDDNNNTHTTMPVSIIITNFPIQLDKQIAHCEAVYFKKTVHSSSDILFLPDNPSEGTRRRMTENEISPGASKTSQVGDDFQDEKWMSLQNQYCRSKEAKTESSRGKFNVFVLKYCEETSSEFRYKDKHKSRKWEKPARRLESPEKKEPFDERVPNTESSGLAHPKMSEQMLLFRDLIKKPLRDVIKSYYELKELDKKYSELMRASSRDVSWKRKMPRKVTDETECSSRKKYGLTAPEEKRKETAERETQVSIGEDGLRSSSELETVKLGSPKTKKMTSSGNNTLPPFYLFGNQDLGWSSSPLNIVAGKKLKSRSCTDAKTTSKHSLINAEGSRGFSTPEKPVPEGGIVSKNGSDGSCRLVLPPRQVMFPNNSPTNNLSMEILPGEEEPSTCSTESDESFSLFYSKTADLASPLLDMKRFIYPDHIHYSYKNVKKKGFDIELSGGLPLLVRDSLTFNSSLTVKRIDSPPDPQTGIVRRPMDLSFVRSFDKLKDSQQSSSNMVEDSRSADKNIGSVREPSPSCRFRQKKEQKWLRKFTKEVKYKNLRHAIANEIVDSSSTHLHTNKGRRGTVNGPVAVLETNKLNKKNLRKARLKLPAEGCAPFCRFVNK